MTGRLLPRGPFLSDVVLLMLMITVRGVHSVVLILNPGLDRAVVAHRQDSEEWYLTGSARQSPRVLNWIFSLFTFLLTDVRVVLNGWDCA